MASILPFLRVNADHFDDEATRVMDIACAELQDSNLSDAVREIIAERIIEAAKRGERVAIAAVSPEQKIG